MVLFREVRRFCSTKLLQKIHIRQCIDRKGFDGVLSKVNILNAGNGNCTAELKLEEEHVNALGLLHGGLSATLVDNLSTYALMTHENGCSKVAFSIVLNFEYFKTASLGDTIIIEAKTMHAEKTLACINCEIRDKNTEELLVKGSHTKFITERIFK